MSRWICPFCLERCIKGDRKYGLGDVWVHDDRTAPSDKNMHGPVFIASNCPKHAFLLVWEV